MTTGPHDFIVGRPSRGRPTMLTPELREELCAHLAQGAPIKTACGSRRDQQSHLLLVADTRQESPRRATTRAHPSRP